MQVAPVVLFDKVDVVSGSWLPRISGGTVAECLELLNDAIGLQACIVLDDETLGPAAGGIRTMAYPSFDAAKAQAHALAAAMTQKCALAGLDAGGGKAVLRVLPEMDRAACFDAIGKAVRDLGGRFHTAGDLGTFDADLAIAQRHSPFVHSDEAGLSSAVAEGLWHCLRGAGVDVTSRSVVVQGVGDIGHAWVRLLRDRGVRVWCADTDADRLQKVCASTGATAVDVNDVFDVDADVFSPCGPSLFLTVDWVRRLKPKVVCGGANLPFVDDDAEQAFVDDGGLYVPDVVASAGGVIQGIATSIMQADPQPLLQRLQQTTQDVLQLASSTSVRPSVAALQMAQQRLRGSRP